jgi:hypothetical protein
MLALRVRFEGHLYEVHHLPIARIGGIGRLTHIPVIVVQLQESV